VTAGFYVMGDDSGARYKEGTAIITEREESSPLEGMLELSLTLEGTGALTEDTVT
jgi:hypothetical protein